MDVILTTVQAAILAAFTFVVMHDRRRAARDRRDLSDVVTSFKERVGSFGSTVQSLENALARLRSKPQDPDADAPSSNWSRLVRSQYRPDELEPVVRELLYHSRFLKTSVVSDWYLVHYLLAVSPLRYWLRTTAFDAPEWASERDAQWPPQKERERMGAAIAT